MVWGRKWGLLEGRFEEELKREEGIGNERRSRGLAMEILGELYRTITDFQRLRERYGVVEEGDGAEVVDKKGRRIKGVWDGEVEFEE